MTTRPPLLFDSNKEIRVLHVGTDVATATESQYEDEFDVETVTSAEVGLERVRTGDFDCIVSAYDLPGRNGIEFLKSVRDEYSDLPFILFTENGSEEIASDAISAGVTDYVRKKSGTDESLATHIQGAVTQHQSEYTEQRLLELAENTDRVVYLFTHGYNKLLFVSSAYEDIWGRSIADLYEDPTDFIEGVHPDDRDRAWNAMEKVANGEPVDIEYRVNAEENYQRWVRVRADPIVDEDGAVVRIAGFVSDITEEHHRKKRRERQQRTLIDLATDEAVTSGDFDRALHKITETAAEVIDVSSVNIWLAEEDNGGKLTCVDHYERESDEHSSGSELAMSEYPAYVEALETHRAIDATDPREDPRTSEFIDYLDRNGIASLLDGTLRSEGEVFGVICHEHTGDQREWTEDEIEFVSNVANIVHRALRNHERDNREQELRRERQQFERVLDTSPVGIALLGADGTVKRINERAEDIFGHESAVGADWTSWGLVDERGQSVPDEQLPCAQVLETGEPVYNAEYGLETDSGELRWLSINAAPLSVADDEQRQVLIAVRDITERHREERTLKTLQERTQAMARTEDREAIAGIAVETMDELLGFDGTIMFEFDGTDKLVGLEWSTNTGTASDSPPVARQGDGLLWDVFADGEPQSVDDLTAADSALADIPLSSAFVLPVGNHGVLVTGTAEPSTLSTTQQKAAHLIRENLDAALDRADREQRLRERDRTLQRQNEQLEQLNRLNTVIRETTAAVIQSTSRGDIERQVCERIAAGTEYSFAWFGRQDGNTGRLVVSEWDEMDPEYVEYLESQDCQTPIHKMVERAFRDGSIQVAQHILEKQEWKPHRRDALNQGYRSVAVVPVTARDHVSSVLVIHGTAADLFDDREQAVLGELGNALGYAVRNIDRSRTLQNEQQTEIDVRIDDERLFSNQFAAALGVDLALVGAIAGDGDSLRAFVRLSAQPDGEIEDTLLALKTVTDVQSLGSKENATLYQVTIETPQLIRRLQASDVRLRSLTVDDETTTITALLTGETAVREVIEELQAAYPETVLHARRESTDPVDTRETFRDQLLDKLTEKQFDALQTALYGGFYEWPRTSTREELASTRDIASSTFSHHLRAAERKVLSTVLDSV